MGQYAHGNEPSHHVAYLASYAGDAGATADRISKLCDDMYSNAPDGLCGNEDCGQMSAWFVWSALGMYPVVPGSGELVLGSPMFKRAVVSPSGGANRTEIRARGLHGQAKYITGMRWHDAEGHSSPVLKRSFIPVQDLIQGGTMELLMAGRADATFGANEEDRPHSEWQSSGFVAVPSITAPRTFQGDSAVVTFGHLSEHAEIQWSSDDGIHWQLADTTLILTETTELSARAILKDDTSEVVSHRVLNVDHQWVLTLQTPPDNQYTAGGPQALIDGLKGGKDFRTGEWQGFWGEPCVATVDLGQIEQIKSIELNALQDIKPWIWSPESVVFSSSVDGETFDVLERVESQLSARDKTVQEETFSCNKTIDAAL